MPPVQKRKKAHPTRTQRPKLAKSIFTEFEEGDVVVRVSKTGGKDITCAQDRAVLLKNDVSGPEEGWWTLCFVDRGSRGKKSLDLTGIRKSAFEFYRLAEPEERFQILSAMVGLSFTTDRGPDYFTRWQPKLETVIKPLLDQLNK